MNKDDKLNGRSLVDTAPPKSGMVAQGSSIKPLEADFGKMRVTCNHCETVFLRFASHVRRREKNYCGRACANEGLKVEVHTNCVVCNADMVQSPVLASRVKTCSKECSKQRRRGPSVTRNWTEYKDSIKRISSTSLCSCCGATTGPWVVRGLLKDGAELATLWCRKCHMRDLQEKVHQAKRASDRGIAVAKKMLEKHGYIVTKAAT